jgi:hypothetical protein
MSEAGAARRTRRWTSVAGAWMGIGTSPGALLLGAGIAARHGGPVPLVSILAGLAVLFTIVWFQGRLGLLPPHGDGGNLTHIIPLYLSPYMHRLLGALIAIGMTGWFGFNVGLGGAALSRLLNWPQSPSWGQWLAVLVIGAPILALSLRGIRGWNGLATLTTISVVVLIVLVVTRLAAHAWPFTLSLGDPVQMVTDVAVMIGYIAVFTVRAPDFTAGMAEIKDLNIAGALLCVPLVATVLAGVSLQQGTGSADLVGVLAGPHGLALGNLLITLAVIAPTFTTFYSGVPALRTATGLGEYPAMLLMGVVGLGLAIARFDLWLLAWLGILGAMLPPIVVPLAVESTLRRMGRAPRRIPFWVWLSSALVALGLTLAHHPLALLAGLATAALATGAWYLTLHRS